MNCFTICDDTYLKGIPVFGNKLGSPRFPLAHVAETEEYFPKACLSSIRERGYISPTGERPDFLVDVAYFYQCKDEQIGSPARSLIPVIIADQPYYSHRSLVMLAIKKGQSYSPERGNYPLWECTLPSDLHSGYTSLKLIGIDRESWIRIETKTHQNIFECRGYRFDYHQFKPSTRH